MEAEEGRAGSQDIRRPFSPSLGGRVISSGALSSHPSSRRNSARGEDHRRTSILNLDEATPLTAMKDWMVFPPEDSVYSYLTFMAPVEQRRTGRFFTPLMSFAVLLVLVNFFMQVGLLYVVGQHIMRKHNEWVSSVAHLKTHAWYHVFPMEYNKAQPACRGNDSPLCSERDGGINCSPLSAHVLADWDLLDADGDGLWTREEADDGLLGQSIKCDYNVDLPSLYNDLVDNLNKSTGLQGRRDTNLFTGAAVHKAYLNWYLHKPLLCTYGDQDMCGALFERGFFDEALQQQSSSDFKDTKSALKYCNDLLQYECFNILPNTYRVWRFVSNQQCGAKVFGQSDYHNPVDNAVVPMLSVDFAKRREYATTKTAAFRCFLGILLVTFLSVMALEMRSIVKVLIFCAKFPSDDEEGREDGRMINSKSVRINTTTTPGYESVGDERVEITKEVFAIRLDHRFMVCVMTGMRLMLWCFLMWSGIMFLTGPPRYLTLIFDALSLVFIFEIDELLYRTMLRHEFKVDHETIEPMKVPQWHGGRFSGNAGVYGDILWLFAVIALGIAVVWTYCRRELDPLLNSLECLCSNQGSECYAAQQYSKAWWDSYWSTVLPASNMIIDKLKGL